MRPFVVFLCLAALLIPSGASSGDVVLTVTVNNPSVSPAEEGGGGGSGGGLPTGGTVRFSGVAYPDSPVIALKDGQIAATVTAQADSTFFVELPGLSPGIYLFSFYAKDKEGNSSSLFSVPLAVSANFFVTQVSGIFLSPTLVLSTEPLPSDDESLIIAGQSVPRATVQIEVAVLTPGGKKIVAAGRTPADILGRYRYELSGSGLAPTVPSGLARGDYEVRTRTVLADKSLSDWSPVAYFQIGPAKKILVQPRTCALLRGDMNGDCRVNLVDFSIMVYWFGRANPPPPVDLNGDSAVNLTDLSIATYYWTG